MPRVTQPRADEPIRLVENKTGHVYRVTIDTAPKGAPRRQITRTFPTLKTAREFVQTTRETQARGSYIAPQPITLAQLCTDWLASKRDVKWLSRPGRRPCAYVPKSRGERITEPSRNRFK